MRDSGARAGGIRGGSAKKTPEDLHFPPFKLIPSSVKYALSDRGGFLRALLS
jgi:hypothetical protein